MAPKIFGEVSTVTALPAGLGLIVFLAGFCLVAGAWDANAGPRFERDIVPILRTKCTRCHGGKALKGELDLRTLGSLLKGSESGEVVVGGRPEESLLLVRIVAGENRPLP